MGEHQHKKNQRLWDGLHEFSPKCYTCTLIETDYCLGCQGNGSGEFDFYTGPDENLAAIEEEEKQQSILCDGCCYQDELYPTQCMYCINNCNYEEAD